MSFKEQATYITDDLLHRGVISRESYRACYEIVLNNLKLNALRTKK